jgi:rhodanese-related sulfurtransferase
MDEYLDPKVYAWISIHEPEDGPHVTNETLDRLPNLKLRFWDITEPLVIIGEEFPALPATQNDIQTIFEFLITHQEKNIIANCRAGVSRSGAISQFCSDFLGHVWDDESKRRAVPNHYIYRGLVEEYQKYKGHNMDYPFSPLKIVDRRSTTVQ